jgi:CRP-like cAMP-binding protein
MEKRKYLCLMDLPIFSGMDQNTFASICHTTRKQHIRKGEFLFRQGDPEDVIYYIKAGSFKLVRITEDGEEVIIQIVGMGDTIGETALFQEGSSSPIAAIALQDAKVCSINRISFERLIREKPEIALQIIRNLSDRLYDTWERITEMNTQTVREKVTSLLIQLAQEHGQPCAEGMLIKLGLTQQEIASVVGASRVMVSHALQELIRNDIIYKKKKYYVLRSKCSY